MFKIEACGEEMYWVEMYHEGDWWKASIDMSLVEVKLPDFLAETRSMQGVT